MGVTLAGITHGGNFISISVTSKVKSSFLHTSHGEKKLRDRGLRLGLREERGRPSVLRRFAATSHQVTALSPRLHLPQGWVNQ